MIDRHCTACVVEVVIMVEVRTLDGRYLEQGAPSGTHEDDVVSPFNDLTWESLLLSIEKGKCTPFIRAGASSHPRPSQDAQVTGERTPLDEMSPSGRWLAEAEARDGRSIAKRIA
jgi:hypothetical protein